MNLSDEIRKQIEKNKGLKLAVGEINNHLSILENLVRKDIMEQVDEAYQKGFEDGKWKSEDGCTGCKYEGKVVTGPPCITCCNSYKNQWTAKDDEIVVGDEVIWTQDEIAIVVTCVYTENNIEWCDGICRDGKAYSILTENARKTGRHFDIASILEDMRND